MAKPTDYTWIYDDSGSGTSRDGSIWMPIAPTGYVALGIVTVSGYDKPSLDLIRCVKSTLTASSGVLSGAFIVDDHGNGSNHSFTANHADHPNNVSLGDGQVFLSSGSCVIYGPSSARRPMRT